MDVAVYEPLPLQEQTHYDNKGSCHSRENHTPWDSHPQYAAQDCRHSSSRNRVYGHTKALYGYSCQFRWELSSDNLVPRSG